MANSGVSRPKMDRRDFSKQIAWGRDMARECFFRKKAATLMSRFPIPYHADAYHGGGVAGHMPSGAWRDIFDALRSPELEAFCLDIEPESWMSFRRPDPQAYRELKSAFDHHIQVPGLMVVAPSLKPYGWAIGGESNIRQLLRGCEVIREHFPNVG